MNTKGKINKWSEKIWFVWNDTVAIIIGLVAVALLINGVFHLFGIDPSPLDNFVRSLFS